jgi:hypothetical protein
MSRLPRQPRCRGCHRFVSRTAADIEEQRAEVGGKWAWIRVPLSYCRNCGRWDLL